MKCVVCHLGTSNNHPTLGVLPCTSCTKKQSSFSSPQSQVEFTSESIKKQRKIYRKDILPMHNRGELDKGWVDRFGAKKAKQRGFTDKEIKKAKYVWDATDSYYKEH